MSAANEPKKLYIAGMGAITSVGCNVAMTSAAVNAGVSGYALSRYRDKHRNPITMAIVPQNVFLEFNAEIEEGDRYCVQFDRIIKMAIIAAKEALGERVITQPMPHILGMPEPDVDTVQSTLLLSNLAAHCSPWLTEEFTQIVPSGRASGLEAIDVAFSHARSHDFVLVGASDSYYSGSRLTQLDETDRILVRGSQDAFAPAEAAGFLLLTPHLELALKRNGSSVALHKPGIAEELGHLRSNDNYAGDGLDAAFKLALAGCQSHIINSIYSSMNGESYWAKEIGVAHIRNRLWFHDNVVIKHPADCYGDIGAATALVLVELAAEHMLTNSTVCSQLVCSSSDTAKRGAIVVERVGAVAL